VFYDTHINGLKIFQPKLHEDQRGFFYESFNEQNFLKNINRNIKFVQDNHSMSQKGVIRGMHLQKKPYEQAKLVRVVRGSIFDVVIDLRRNSKTYLKTFSIEISSLNFLQLWIPEGFAHGFQALEDNTEIIYKTNNYYSKNHEEHIKYDDERFQIDWPLKNIELSDKDKYLTTYTF
jgi:dTDP-4-dehydrorhamnose 3,5-epimerase